MKRMSGLMLAAAIMMQSIPAVAASPESELLDVSSFTIMDEDLVYIGADYLNPAMTLFDSQEYAPESPDKTNVGSEKWNATDRSKNWKPNWQSEFGEDAFFMDLGANYVITGICFLDTNGVQDWIMEDGEPFNWNTCVDFTTDAYQTWRGIQIEKPRSTRYLRFSTPCGDSGVAELALYGYKESELTAAQKAKTAVRENDSDAEPLTAGQQIGFNAFIDDPMTAIMAAGNVREYHNLSWMFDDTGKVKFTQGTWGDMDSYYSAMHARNISIIPCFQGGSSVISGGKTPPEIAVPNGADPTDPASYALHAQAMYQVAARYGSNKNVDPATLNVADGSEPKVGMGLLQAAENSNEPNKTWSGKANYFTPFELAAMCSADYDGHEGTIPHAGVKQADPHFQLAMGGMLNTASLLDYLSQMKLWFNYNRTDGKFAVDIINVHLGPDTYNPEDSSFTARVQEIKQWIQENAPGTKLWISEFEIPMTDCETEGIDNHDNETYQLRYAQRVARTYLMAMSAGVDRMTKFQLRDEGEGVYYNSGLVTGKGEWKKKQAWYYTACMTNVLKNMEFRQEIRNGTAAVRQYEFVPCPASSSTDTVYCLWSPTNADTVVKDYALSVPKNAHVYLTVPGTYAEGTVSELTNQNGKVKLDVSETPVFVTVSAQKQTIINGKGKYISPKTICLSQDGSTEICDLSAAPTDTKLNQFYRMFDEPAAMPDMIYGDTASLPSPETNVNASGITCYVALDQPYVISGFQIYDTFGTGSFAVYDAHTDRLLWLSDMGGYMSRNTALLNDSAPTDCLKIVKGGGDLNECGIYGYPAPDTGAAYDINGDGIFDAKDAIALQAWLTKQDASEIANWAAGDCNSDQKLDARDLSRLKRRLS